jgi:hypothetical protein
LGANQENFQQRRRLQKEVCSQKKQILNLVSKRLAIKYTKSALGFVNFIVKKNVNRSLKSTQ